MRKGTLLLHKALDFANHLDKEKGEGLKLSTAYCDRLRLVFCGKHGSSQVVYGRHLSCSCGVHELSGRFQILFRLLLPIKHWQPSTHGDCRVVSRSSCTMLRLAARHRHRRCPVTARHTLHNVKSFAMPWLPACRLG